MVRVPGQHQSKMQLRFFHIALFRTHERLAHVGICAIWIHSLQCLEHTQRRIELTFPAQKIANLINKLYYFSVVHTSFLCFDAPFWRVRSIATVI
ncbi:hypothetical protein WI89_07115 [Burkholderia ubonensis]|nr:hypothetical protein WI89_07115 [Burkholderia ubonensis]